MEGFELSHSKLFTNENCLGSVSQTSATSITIALPNTSAHGENTTNGALPPIDIGTYLVVDCDDLGIVAQITEIRILDHGLEKLNERASSTAIAALLTTVNFKHQSIIPGVQLSPHIGCKVYLAPPPLIASMIDYSPGSTQSEKNIQGDQLLLSFAHLADKDRTAVPLTPERLFGHHCAVLGASGGGKSWTLARIMEDTARFHSKIILFDPSGEYYTLAKNTKHVFIGTDPLPDEAAEETVLPYHELTESDLFAIFRPEGQSQAPKLRAAMESLKIARLDSWIAPDGTILKADRSKIEYHKSYRRYLEEIEDPQASFDIRKLPRQIINECVHPNRSPVEPLYWGGANTTEQAQCMPLVTRIEDFINAKNLSPVFQPGQKRSLLAEIDAFLQDEELRILRIALQYLSTAHNAREIIANAAGRHLFQRAREGRFRERPLLVVLDEAHRFLNDRLSNRTLNYPLDSFGLVAKEGRKYSINVCLSTQRPNDIPQDVLSQVGTILVHRIISDEDLKVVERASGALNKSSAISIPGLIPGEAVIIGIGFPVPLNVFIDPPDCPPDSRGPNFQKFWR